MVTVDNEHGHRGPLDDPLDRPLEGKILLQFLLKRFCVFLKAELNASLSGDILQRLDRTDYFPLLIKDRNSEEV